jgi:hypothetical protein
MSCSTKAKTSEKSKTDFPVVTPPNTNSSHDNIGFACNYGGNSTVIVQEFSFFFKRKITNKSKVYYPAQNQGRNI